MTSTAAIPQLDHVSMTEAEASSRGPNTEASEPRRSRVRTFAMMVGLCVRIPPVKPSLTKAKL